MIRVDQIKEHTLEALRGVEIRIHDVGFIRLLDWMGWDRDIEDAARMSYGKGTTKRQDTGALIDYLWRNGHASPFEMCSIKFNIRLPIFVMRQWIRHRTAKLNEMSLRYSEALDLYYHPEEWRANTSPNKQASHYAGDELREKQDLAYGESLELSQNAYNDLLHYDTAREMARMVLPVSNYTEIVWKMDLRNLLGFLQQRLDEHAQKEIRDYAEAIKEIVRLWVPYTWSAFENHTLKALKLSFDETALISKMIANEPIADHLKGMGVLSRNFSWNQKSTKTEGLIKKMERLGLFAQMMEQVAEEKEIHNAANEDIMDKFLRENKDEDNG